MLSACSRPAVGQHTPHRLLRAGLVHAQFVVDVDHTAFSMFFAVRRSLDPLDIEGWYPRAGGM